jgi:C_GCAxxG_C_C family probable redox protein
VGEHKWVDWDPRYLRLSTGLGGGIGGTREEVCGALSGGVLAIGGLLGRQDPDTNDDEAYALCEEFRTRFLAEMGDTQCARLREAIDSPGGPGTCAPLVARAAGILMDILNGAKPQLGQ